MRNHDDDDESELHQREMPDESDMDDEDDADGSVDVEACAYCGREIFDQADICPYCHSFVNFATIPAAARRPAWFWLVVVLLVGVLTGALSILIGVLW